MIVELPWECGARVHIDGDATITAAVVEYTVRLDQRLVRLQWLMGGALQDAWFDLFRVSVAE